MSRVHRILLCIVDSEEYPDNDVAHAIQSAIDCVRIVEHEAVTVNWRDDHILNRQTMTPERFNAWFNLAKPSIPTVQTAISLIRSAPEGTEDKLWLEHNVLELLYEEDCWRAVRVILEEDETGRSRSFLIQTVLEILGACAGTKRTKARAAANG